MEAKKKTPEQVREEITNHNLRFYTQGCEVPADALKTITAGRLKNKSDVNPMWRMKRMTEMFGPCGIGWKYTIDKQWTECYGNEVKCFCNVSLYIRDPETKEWSEAIPGNGGSAIVKIENSGKLYVDDEGYKMALTDALSIAMKPLGIGANVWYGPKATGRYESKYEEDTSPRQSVSYPKITPQLAKQAFMDLDRVKTREEYNAVWQTYSKYADFVKIGGEFYNACIEKSKTV